MATKLDHIMAAMPERRRGRIEGRAMELATRQELSKAFQRKPKSGRSRNARVGA